MSRTAKILATIGASVAGLGVVLVVGGILVLRTQGFQNFVKQKIISTTEDSTGGKVDIGSFEFDWTHLRATIRNFVLHGTEPASEQPLFRASLIQVDLKLFPSFGQIVDLTALLVDTPQANLIVAPDGTTNVPTPKVKSTSNKSGLETIVDLRIGRFDVEHGSAAFNEKKTQFTAKGENLRALLQYNQASPGYQGNLEIKPLHLTAGRNQPVDFNITLPVSLQKDGVTIAGGKITSPESQITVDASVTHMAAPRTSAKLTARLALDEVSRLANAPLSLARGPDLPSALDLTASMAMDDKSIHVDNLHVGLGQSTVDASGPLRDPSQQTGLQFRTSLALGQLAKLFKAPAQVQGTLQSTGAAKLTGASSYSVLAEVDAPNLAVQQGQQKFNNLSLHGALQADNDQIRVSGLRLGAFGGEITGSIALQQMERLRIEAQLRGFAIDTLAKTFAAMSLPYDGVISGPVEANVNLKASGTSGVSANAKLAISPRGKGIPVNGRLDASYKGASDLISIGDSFIALPNTRLDLAGSLDQQLTLKLVSHNLNDFQPLVAPNQLPVSLRGGAVSFTGAVNGKLADPRLSGHLQATNFRVEDRPFDRLDADVAASSAQARLDNGALSRATTRLQFAGAVGLDHWKALPQAPLTANATIRNADLRDVMAIAGQSGDSLTGTLNASAQIGGTIGDPRGNANLTVANGTAYDEHFDKIEANVDLTDQQVRLSKADLTAGTARIDMTALFQHPHGSFATGQIQAHLSSNAMSLDQFRNVQKQQPGLAGVVQLSGDVAARLATVNNNSEVTLTAVTANATGRGLQWEGRNLGDFTAAANTSGSQVDFRVDSNFAGSTIHANGQTQLAAHYPTSASASIRDLSIEQVLLVAGRNDIDVKGTLGLTGQFTGTLDNPQASADVTVAKVVAYGQPVDLIQARASYTNQAINLPSLAITAGPARIEANAAFTHPAGDFQTGHAQFHLASSGLTLAQVNAIEKQMPGLNGTVQLAADGAADLRKPAQAGGAPDVLLSQLNAQLALRGVQKNQQALGNLTASAQTRGTALAFQLDSDLAKSSIHGEGQATLQGDYPVTAQLKFSNVTYAGLQPLLSAVNTSARPPIDGLLEGDVSVSGPARKPDELSGTAHITTLKLTTQGPHTTGKAPRTVALQNEGPLVLSLNRSVLKIESGHITGPSTNINVAGTVSFREKAPMNLQIDATSNLSLLQSLDSDVYSSGSLSAKVVVRGTFSDPQMNGQVDLKNASVNLASVPNGISNANGTILLNGNNAVIRNLTGESGGGKITLSGFLGFAGGTLRYNLHANAGRVRVRTPQGISVVASATVGLTGTSERSLLSGTVTLERLGFNPRSDIGSILSRSSAPAETPSAPSGPLAGMKLDIRIQTAPDVEVSTAMAQNVEASADLTLRGTPDSPGMLGRVTVTSGKLVFFGTSYNVNQGSISFFNPVKIEPILDVDLETKTQGVDVILSVSGPVDNMTLTYRSDPPLQFNEIVALLAAGTPPSSDPNLAAQQPATPPQNLQQMGESAIVSQAIASPVADRLQRVFGVSSLKIDPNFISGSQIPSARLTLQQQISGNIMFTYVEDLSQSNSEIIKVEFALNPRWSAVAMRDENGQFGVDFYYKKRFR
jgi:translocation and assembly module TamB